MAEDKKTWLTLDLSPSHENFSYKGKSYPMLYFKYNDRIDSNDSSVTIDLVNNRSSPALFKFKTNKVMRYVVSPNQGIIGANSSTRVFISLAKQEIEKVRNQWVEEKLATSGSNVTFTDGESVPNFIESVPKDKFMLICVWQSEEVRNALNPENVAGYNPDLVRDNPLLLLQRYQETTKNELSGTELKNSLLSLVFAITEEHKMELLDRKSTLFEMLKDAYHEVFKLLGSKSSDPNLFQQKLFVKFYFDWRAQSTSAEKNVPENSNETQQPTAPSASAPAGHKNLQTTNQSQEPPQEHGDAASNSTKDEVESKTAASQVNDTFEKQKIDGGSEDTANKHNPNSDSAAAIANEEEKQRLHEEEEDRIRLEETKALEREQEENEERLRLERERYEREVKEPSALSKMLDEQDEANTKEMGSSNTDHANTADSEIVEKMEAKASQLAQEVEEWRAKFEETAMVLGNYAEKNSQLLADNEDLRKRLNAHLKRNKQRREFGIDNQTGLVQDRPASNSKVKKMMAATKKEQPASDFSLLFVLLVGFLSFIIGRMMQSTPVK
eukprot:g1845.t1